MRGICVQVIGGPLGTGAGLVELGHEGMGDAYTYNGDGGMLPGFGMGAMESIAGRKRSEVLPREKLPERCEFVSTLMEKLGV